MLFGSWRSKMTGEEGGQLRRMWKGAGKLGEPAPARESYQIQG